MKKDNKVAQKRVFLCKNSVYYIFFSNFAEFCYANNQ